MLGSIADITAYGGAFLQTSPSSDPKRGELTTRGAETTVRDTLVDKSGFRSRIELGLIVL